MARLSIVFTVESRIAGARIQPESCAAIGQDSANPAGLRADFGRGAAMRNPLKIAIDAQNDAFARAVPPADDPMPPSE
jgi:hypothetical protein